jgi:predicted dinucleotide-binding enzyme
VGDDVIGMVGSGAIATAVARTAIAAGMGVVLSNSRGPDTLTDLVGELGPSARAATAEEAARAGDLVLVSIPFGRFQELPPAPFAGRTVLDTNNFVPGRDHNVAHLVEAGPTAAELLQQHLPDAWVVKAFNTINVRHLEALARPSGAPDRSALPVASDWETAKSQAVQLLDRLGWDAVDAGSLADTWRIDLGTPAFVRPYVASTEGDWPTRLAVDPGAPAGVARISELLAAAVHPDRR